MATLSKFAQNAGFLDFFLEATQGNIDVVMPHLNRRHDATNAAAGDFHAASQGSP